MAGFVQVMKEWQRMCEAMKHCDECPMSGTTCWYGGRPDDSKSDFDYYEQQIMKWVEENPEPIYQTWREYLQEQGVLDVEYISAASSTTSTSKSYVQTVKTLAPFYRPIPADIAEKLGLQPKE